MAIPQQIDAYVKIGLTPIPLKPRSKEPLVRWRNGWNPTYEELQAWATASKNLNWAVRCGPELAALDFDSPQDFDPFCNEHHLPLGCLATLPLETKDIQEFLLAISDFLKSVELVSHGAKSR